MKSYPSDAILELNAKERDAFAGTVEATPDMLTVTVRDRKGAFEFTYKSFRERVEHAASELHYETDRTVLICDEESGDTLAMYNERGLLDESPYEV